MFSNRSTGTCPSDSSLSCLHIHSWASQPDSVT